jgi:hypothetical protein
VPAEEFITSSSGCSNEATAEQAAQHGPPLASVKYHPHDLPVPHRFGQG